MDNSNFEETFRQSIKDQTVQPVIAKAPEKNINNEKTLLTISIIFGIITLVESIILVLTLVNYFSVVNGGNSAEDDIIAEATLNEAKNNNFVYDKDYNLIAMNLTCTNSEGSTISLDTSNAYTIHGTNGSSDTSGSYVIANDSLVSLPEISKVLYYDGFDLADGLVIYSCN